MSNKSTFPLLPGEGHTFFRPPKYKPIAIVDPRTRSPLKKRDDGSISRVSGDKGLAALAAKEYHRQSDHQSQPAEAPTQAWKANVYAQPYIPESLSTINLSHATVVSSTSIASIDFHDYVSSFAGKQYLRLHGPVEPLVPSNASSQVFSSLTTTNYKAVFGGALAAEFEAEASAVNSYNLHGVQLHCVDPREPMYELRVPGLREDRPRVDLGDTIMLRQLRMDHRTGRPWGMEQWLIPGGGRDRGFIAPGFTGIQYNASVWGLNRTKEKVILRIDGCVDQGLIFNVMFRVQQRRFELFQRAIADISHQIRHDCRTPLDAATIVEHSQGQANGNGGTVQGVQRSELDGEPIDHTNEFGDPSAAIIWMRRMLFPNHSDGVEQEGLPQGVFKQEFFDESLNYEQQKAVDSIQQQNYGSIPFLISGPPGTGKTKTIVETALQHVYRTRSMRTHILLCAPSDPAADILALRVKAHVPYQDLFRLNSPSRSFAEVPGSLLPYCHIIDDLFCLPDFHNLMSYRIVVTTCRDADILVQARITNRDLVKLEKGITVAIHFGGNADNFKPSLHWTALLVDEAAQATEPEIGIPLTVVAPPDKGSYGEVLVVMAGDQFQLGPRVISGEVALERSLFERLIDRHIYRDHPLARRLLRQSTLAKGKEQMIRPPFANLFQNYRSHPAILAIPSILFYHDTLIPKATDTECMEDWVGWKGRRWPVLFACNVGDDERELEGCGWYNRREIKKACDYAKSLVDQALLEERDICIMSPFRAQVQLLRRTIRDEPYKLREVNIGPMEAFQGLESRFVIICTTRTRSRYVVEDLAAGLGMINEAKRFNVAMTRAKEGLVVIGNPWILYKDNSWNAFIKFCWRHGLWEDDLEDQQATKGGVGDEARGADAWAPSDEVTPPYISSLERGMVYKEKQHGWFPTVNKLSLTTHEEDAMWVSGHAAEQALCEE